MSLYIGQHKAKVVHIGEDMIKRVYLGNAIVYQYDLDVSATLVGCSATLPSKVYYGEPLVAALVPDTGYRMDANSVSVTMGGVDITATAYDEATSSISIAKVTGDVGIEAEAVVYDAEVEWLRGDGSAYINTGITNKNTVTVYAGIRIESSSATIIDICGARASTSSNQNAIIFYYANGFLYRYNTTTKYAPNTTVLGDYVIRTVTYSTFSTLYVSGAATSSATIEQSATFSNTFNYLIFNFSNNGTAQTPAGTGLKIKYFKLYDGTTLVRDFIPVRKDGVGYLYDKVSRQLFGNANSSGTFTYGNDVNAAQSNNLLGGTLLGGSNTPNEPNNDEPIGDEPTNDEPTDEPMGGNGDEEEM